MFLKETSPFKLLFIGDSITDCGRGRATAGADLGDGYVRQVDAMLRAHYPQLDVKVLNTGISGNRVDDLEVRWNRDVTALKPDYLSIMIGINDVWRQHDSPHLDQIDLETYTVKLERLIEKTLPTLKGLVVMSPFFLETNNSDPMRVQMNAYGAAAKEIAKHNSLPFVDLQAAFDSWLAHHPADQLSDDRVHPNHIGHNIIASAFLNAIGFVW